MNEWKKSRRFTKEKLCLVYLTILLIFISSFLTAYADSSGEGVVTVQYLNVRRNPSTEAAIIGQLLKDTTVTINESSGNWYKITFKSLTGWVHGDYIELKQETALPSGQSSGQPSTAQASGSGESAGETPGKDPGSAGTPGEEAKPAEAYAEESKDTAVVTANILNVRESPGTSAKVIGQLCSGMEVKVQEEGGMKDEYSWYKVSYGKITGWVAGEYISFEKEPIDEGAVNVDVANVRSGPGLDQGIVTTMKKGNKVTIYSWYDEWYKIKLEDGSFAWIFGELVTTRKDLLMRGVIASRGEATASSLGQQIVNYAKRFLGVRYVWGGTSPNGFDCSGLVQYVYKQFGITLNRVAADQAKQGTTVSRTQLRPGDLLFFNTSSGSSIDHVGIYIGNNQFIHASNGRKKVIIDPLNTGYYSNRLIIAKRIVN
ncbi:MAG: SH3 domain-containing protein [Clostridiaceae bacterium]|nr:SH3 domain-containing protein [Clostridiaceae bacterium]